MKPDKNPFLANMNTVKLEGKKVMVRPSQAGKPRGRRLS
jgi:hypothetical protein